MRGRAMSFQPETYDIEGARLHRSVSALPTPRKGAIMPLDVIKYARLRRTTPQLERNWAIIPSVEGRYYTSHHTIKRKARTICKYTWCHHTQSSSFLTVK